MLYCVLIVHWYFTTNCWERCQYIIQISRRKWLCWIMYWRRARTFISRMECPSSFISYQGTKHWQSNDKIFTLFIDKSRRCWQVWSMYSSPISFLSSDSIWYSKWYYCPRNSLWYYFERYQFNWRTTHSKNLYCTITWWVLTIKQASYLINIFIV